MRPFSSTHSLKPKPSFADVWLVPSEQQTRRGGMPPGTDCVVIDTLRASSSMLAALAQGAAGVVPVRTIEEALAWRRRAPDALLAGERGGWKIDSKLTGGAPFDLGNSPREFLRAPLQGRLVVMTTTNGTKAVHAARGARRIRIAALANVGATAECLLRHPPERLLLICAGTGSEAALEDILTAGALLDRLLEARPGIPCSDAALLARAVYRTMRGDLPGALARSANGRRLLDRPELREDVEWCARADRYAFCAAVDGEGVVRIGEGGD